MNRTGYNRARLPYSIRPIRITMHNRSDQVMWGQLFRLSKDRKISYQRQLREMIVSAILGLCHLSDGMNKVQLRVFLLVWLTVLVHCGAVAMFPHHTMAVLAVTIWPSYRLLEAMYPDHKEPVGNKGTFVAANARCSRSPSSPSSVQANQSNDLQAR